VDLKEPTRVSDYIADLKIFVMIVLLLVFYPVGAFVGLFFTGNTAIRKKLAGESLQPHTALVAGWLAFTAFLPLFWFYATYYVGMGIGHAPTKGQAAPASLIAVTVTLLGGYVWLSLFTLKKLRAPRDQAT